jgi:hypothetical protein
LLAYAYGAAYPLGMAEHAEVFTCVLIEDLNGPYPLLSLAVINLSQIKNRLLDNAIASATPIFYNRPVVVLLAVF